MHQLQTKASPNLRTGIVLGAVVLLALWGASAIPAVKNWNNPREDGFSLLPLFWASLTLLPLGISALAGAIAGSEASIRRARLHLMVAAALIGLVILLDIFRRMLIALDGE
jgi:hypothetical protein